MSFGVLSYGARYLIRSLFANSSTDSSGRAKLALVRRSKLLTSVAGHNDKISHYSTQVKRKWDFGDDACFVTSTESADVIGLADGVGGWRRYGIDPSNFSRMFMQTCERRVNSGNFEPWQPVVLIAQCYDEVQNAKQQVLGSATICVLCFSRFDNYLYAANLGDSAFLVIREGRIIVRSSEQQHSFNTPFQLSVLPHKLDKRLFHVDSPDQAQQMRIRVEQGDLLVVATDGLFDNLMDQIILEEVISIKKPNVDSLQACAEKLVSMARDSSKQRDHLTPFASEAKRYGINVKGGKPGDITVILGLISLLESY